MLGPATRPSQHVIALDDDTLLGAKRRSRASGFVHWRKAAAAGVFADRRPKATGLLFAGKHAWACPVCFVAKVWVSPRRLVDRGSGW